MKGDRITQLWVLMHGTYGSAWLDKWATGKPDREGRGDMGVLSAQACWRDRLAEFDDETLLRARRACEKSHPKFPPTMHEFADLCRAHRTREVPKQSGLPQVAGPEAVPTEAIMAMKRMLDQRRIERTGDVTLHIEGLPAVRALIAKAHGIAGGDEVDMLQALEHGLGAPEPRAW